MTNCGCDVKIKNRDEGGILIILLCINAFMFLVEISLGIFSESSALIADSLDMIADAKFMELGYMLWVDQSMLK